LSQHAYSRNANLNDVKALPADKKHIQTLMDSGIDDKLAFHIASLFGRDPIPAFSNEFEESTQPTTAHFENLQSTNWNSMRLKPPPSLESPIGWRVEFRTMDIQLTDYENSAMIVMLLMLNNVINNFDVDFLMPISKVDENMDRAHDVDAIFNQKFWFKTKGAVKGQDPEMIGLALQESDYLRSSFEDKEEGEELYEELTIL
jgi:glutamate--cysteine ligase catalytic subunit